MDNIIFKVHIPNGAGIGNTLKGFISGLTVNSNTNVIHITYWEISIPFWTKPIFLHRVNTMTIDILSNLFPVADG